MAGVVVFNNGFQFEPSPLFDAPLREEKVSLRKAARGCGYSRSRSHRFSSGSSHRV